MLAIILPAILAGIVAILVTLAIEKFGGLVGGVLGTIPSTIIPAAAGVYHIDGKEGLLSSMSIVPLAMMVNGIFLSVWIILPKYVSDKKTPLLLTTITSLLIWALFAYIALSIADYSVSIDISPAILGILGLVCLILVSIFFNIKTRPSPKGDNKVPILILSVRGIAAAIAIGLALVLAQIGQPLIAGLASAFPAIFLTSMVALWISQGVTVPQGAAAPMMLGGASVAVYALVVMWSIPSYGIIFGSIIAWLLSVGLWSIPAFLSLRRYRALSID
ncbi:MAG: hypothetical protein DWB99_02120 [Candidatus Poseidoniales archaeon]|nr:MAG: hypothetical protein DWB99_02120 [Candidatus Poseidoniales archaeon]|tara:strand:- start:4451 stop:5275 length:825 start_codon:yes stop_codon:yes gene_type:complete